MINIVIPMAGLGKRFSNEVDFTPKPFIDVFGKPMFVRVIENFNHPDARFIIIARKEHIQMQIELVEDVKNKYNAKFIAIDKSTEGTACTVLHARKHINNDIPLLIVMADQIIDFNLKKFLWESKHDNIDGNLVCFHEKEPNLNLSYAKVNEAGKVTMVKEKEVISNLATAGVYYFKKGKNFVNATIDMIINNERANNEFYVAPVYNYLISKGMNISTYNIDRKQRHDLGTEEKLNAYVYENLQKMGKKC